MGKTKLIIASGVLTGLIFSASLPFSDGPMGTAAVLGFVFLLLTLELLPDGQKSFLAGFGAGAVYFLFAYQWFWSAYPLKIIGAESRLSAFFLILSVWLATGLSSALFWGTATGLFKKVERKFSWFVLLVFPSVFVFFEYLRSFLLGVIWYGPEAHFGPHWTIGNLAYGFNHSWLALKISSWVGVYGLTFLLAVSGATVFALWRKTAEFPKIRLVKKMFPPVFVLALIIFHLAFYLPWQKFFSSPSSPEEKNAAVAAMETDRPTKPSYTGEEQMAFFKNQVEALDNLSKQYPETKLVVFPEGSNFFSTLSLFSDTLSVSQYFARLFLSSNNPSNGSTPSGTLILDNDEIYQLGRLQSKTIFLDTQRGIVGSYDKYLLMPGGEYVPSIFKWLDRLLATDSSLLKTINEYQAGADWPPAINDGSLAVGSLLCSDIVSPSLARQTVKNGANLLAVQSSFAFMNGGNAFIRLAESLMQFRAAENDRSVVNSSNFGPAHLIDNSGLIMGQTGGPNASGNGFKLLTGQVVLNKENSLYNKLGDGPVIVASLFVLILELFWLRFCRRKK